VGRLAEGESGFGENVPVKEIIPLNTGGNDAVFGKLTEGYATQFLLTFGEDLDLGGKYTIMRKHAVNPVEPGKIFASPRFDEVYYYAGNDLGVTYSAEASKFRFWSPTASEVLLKYKRLTDGEWQTAAMTTDVNGTWVATVDGDLNGMEYVYNVTNSGMAYDIVDPYAKAVTVNGKTGAVVDLTGTEPDNWSADEGPAIENPTDAVIYELHVRDFSTHASSGITEANKGKFLAFTETGTTTPDGQATGIDHLKELGVTHVHLLPSFDYASLDETTSVGFNWGYDPLNYNAPEGTYSTDATQPALRIREFKQAVQAMHSNGIGVIMDMVYNHTGPTADSNLNRAVPGYYYRMTASGGFANGSACGNETASERAMVRKFIVDSVTYWASNYHIDGFRFDLMGLHDIDTMNAIRNALDEIDPSIIMYGEGWTAGTTPLPMSQQALKASMSQMDERIAAFSDDIRDGIKGSVFNAADPGYVSGYYGRKEQIKFGVAASVQHDQIDVSRLANSSNFWAAAPSQTITYASAHDNLTLWDKLLASTPNATEEEHLAMNRLSAAIVLTSQGIPFIHAGEEIARTKDGDENSYKSPDSVNQIKWDTKTERRELFDFYKGLIALRKSNPAFRLTTAEDIRNNLVFLDTEAQTLAYTLGGETLVAFNADSDEREITLPMDGIWAVLVDGERAGTEVLYEHNGAAMTLAGRSAYVLQYLGEAPPEETEPVVEEAPPAEATPAPTAAPQPTETPAASGGVNISLIAGIIIAVLALAGLGFYFVKVKKNK
jgi:pullulanase